MKPHYSEADLLETYYTAPGESLPVMLHLADCADCAARYERLERKIRGLAACEHEKQETFWARQRISIMRRIAAQPAVSPASRRMSRIAAAAVVVLMLGGVVTWNRVDEPASRPVVEKKITGPTVTKAATLDDSKTRKLDASDPWASDELSDYQSMVAWESWVESDTKNGDQSL